MNQGPVSCLPMNSKMSKVKKALDEARETQNRELDLVDKNVFSFDEMPGLRKLLIPYRTERKSKTGLVNHFHIWQKFKFVHRECRWYSYSLCFFILGVFVHVYMYMCSSMFWQLSKCSFDHRVFRISSLNFIWIFLINFLVLRLVLRERKWVN